jgi:protein SCO1
MRAALVLALVVVASILLASMTLVEPPRDSAHETFQIEPLPKIAPAPEFTLTSQDGAQISLANLRGKVVAVTFIFTLCTATCPVS